MHLGARNHRERHRLKRVADQDRSRLVEGLVHGRASSPHYVVVHRRQIVMHQRVAVQTFESGAREQRAFARCTEERRGLHQKERPQPLAAGEHGMAHGRKQSLWARYLAGTGFGIEQTFEQDLGLRRDDRKPIGEVLRSNAVHAGS